MNSHPSESVDPTFGAQAPAEEFRVSPEGSADFRTIGEALRAAETCRAAEAFRLSKTREPWRILITLDSGVYREKLAIRLPYVELRGAGASGTIITWDDCATRLLNDGEPMGTFNSYTVYVGAVGVRLRGLSIENSAGDGRLVGPAVALYADSDLFSAQDCRIASRQDSLCAGPLPKNPPPKGINLIHPVAGLGAHQPSLPFRQSYRHCLIEGDVDFIFGSSLAVFEHCEIRSLGRQAPNSDQTSERSTVPEPAGWIAAPSTYPGQKAGFVFLNCALTSAPASGPGAPRSYLARPWRHSGRAAFISCRMGAHIVPEGWDDWGKPEARAFGGFGEFASSGPGAPRENSRAPWARKLSEDEAAALSPEKLFGEALF